MILLLTGLLLILIGYLVKYKQWTWLIAGYNTSSKKEKAKYDTVALCHGVGNIMFSLGGIVFISFIGELLEIEWVVTFGWVLFVIVMVFFLIYANTGNRFKK